MITSLPPEATEHLELHDHHWIVGTAPLVRLKFIRMTRRKLK